MSTRTSMSSTTHKIRIVPMDRVESRLDRARVDAGVLITF